VTKFKKNYHAAAMLSHISSTLILLKM